MLVFAISSQQYDPIQAQSLKKKLRSGLDSYTKVNFLRQPVSNNFAILVLAQLIQA